VKPITFLVGENGSGKSTILEAIAEAYGIDIRGGHGGRRYNNAPPKGPLGEAIKLRRTTRGDRMVGRNAQGYFLRAETALGVFEFMSDHGVAGYGDRHLAQQSHGESFMQLFDAGRFDEPGLFLLDEPEAALSFRSCLRLIGLLNTLNRDDAQVICATHSPLLCSLPGATILELGDHGIRSVQWEDLELVEHWRRYLNHPDSYLRHIIDEP
jgi:predicted ATPase